MAMAVLLHGGAGNYESAQLSKNVAFLEDLLLKIQSVCESEGARASVLAGLKAMEDHPDFNAGTGGNLQADGVIRLTASLMGNTIPFSSVVNLTETRYPSAVAESLLGQTFPSLVGTEATLYAREKGFLRYCNRTPDRMQKFLAGFQGRASTVGVVALDTSGALFAGTSTGGVGGETPGRMSDVSTPCATYASDSIALSATGIGETILNSALLPKIAGLLDFGIPLDTVREYIESALKRRFMDGGLIGVTSAGDLIAMHNTRGMRYAGLNSRGEMIAHWL